LSDGEELVVLVTDNRRLRRCKLTLWRLERGVQVTAETGVHVRQSAGEDVLLLRDDIPGRTEDGFGDGCGAAQWTSPLSSRTRNRTTPAATPAKKHVIARPKNS